MNSPFRYLLIAASMSLLGYGGIARGDGPDLTDLNFEDLASIKVSSASKFLQASREAPSAVEVIGREDIRRHGWRTLVEAINSLPGIYGTNDRAYDFIGARGFLVPGDYNNRFLLLIDGQRTNDNVYEQALFGEEFQIDLALVERIEYVPGPGSSIYGSNAIFGVINVITRRAEEMPPLQLAARFTQNRWVEGRVTLARRLDSGASLLLSLTDGAKSGRDRTYEDPVAGLTVLGGGISPDGVAHDLERERKRSLFGRYEDGALSLTVRHSERAVHPSSALYGTLFNDAGLRVEDVSTSIISRFQKQVADDLGVDLRAEYGEMTYRGDYPYDDGFGNRYLNRDDTLGRWWAGDLRALFTGLPGHNGRRRGAGRHNRPAAQF